MSNNLNHNISNLTEQMSNALKLVSEYTDLMQDIPGNLENTSQLQNFSLNSDAPPDLIAVDGSYSFVLNVSSVWIVILRIGALHYEFKEDSNGIGYVLKHDYLEESPEVISTYHPIVEQQSEVHQKLFNISAKSGGQTHLSIADGLRRLAEDQLAGRLAKETKNTIIALDGALTTQPFRAFQNALKEVVTNCQRNNNILVGVSKDSKTHAFNSFMTDEELLNKSYPNTGFAFTRVPRSFEHGYTPPLWGDVYFTHLSPLTPKWFRVDLGTYKDDPTFAFSSLAHYARSEICPGYIFPLVEAHRYVVTVRHFHQAYEDLIFELGPQFGLNPSDIMRSRTNIEGRYRGAFHEYLDRISKR